MIDQLSILRTAYIVNLVSLKGVAIDATSLKFIPSSLDILRMPIVFLYPIMPIEVKDNINSFVKTHDLMLFPPSNDRSSIDFCAPTSAHNLFGPAHCL